MRPARLDAAALKTTLAALNLRIAAPWELQEGKLHKKFRFKDFRSAFAFMTRVADAAEALNHHPEWRNAYNQVQVALSTHDAGGVTTLDFDLAEAIEAAASEHGALE